MGAGPAVRTAARAAGTPAGWVCVAGLALTGCDQPPSADDHARIAALLASTGQMA